MGTGSSSAFMYCTIVCFASVLTVLCCEWGGRRVRTLAKCCKNSWAFLLLSGTRKI